MKTPHSDDKRPVLTSVRAGLICSCAFCDGTENGALFGRLSGKTCGRGPATSVPVPLFCVLLHGKMTRICRLPFCFAESGDHGSLRQLQYFMGKVNEMKKRIAAIVLCALLVICALPTETFAAQNNEDIVILYENDAHCAVEGYSKLAAMKKELQETYAHVGVVSGGDYIQGSSLGSISQGRYIIDLMNLVGYDAVTLGNHEFDYRMERLSELVGMMNTTPICCNFGKIGEDGPYFQPYTIVSYGEVDVAYIGITTPSTITMAYPTQFQDDNGEYTYTFHPTELYDIVQDTIDAAKSEGADYVIALSHVGYAEDEIYGDLEDVEDLIRNTDGFDVSLTRIPTA